MKKKTTKNRTKNTNINNVKQVQKVHIHLGDLAKKKPVRRRKLRPSNAPIAPPLTVFKHYYNAPPQPTLRDVLDDRRRTPIAEPEKPDTKDIKPEKPDIKPYIKPEKLDVKPEKPDVKPDVIPMDIDNDVRVVPPPPRRIEIIDLTQDNPLKRKREFFNLPQAKFRKIEKELHQKKRERPPTVRKVEPTAKRQRLIRTGNKRQRDMTVRKVEPTAKRSRLMDNWLKRERENTVRKVAPSAKRQK